MKFVVFLLTLFVFSYIVEIDASKCAFVTLVYESHSSNADGFIKSAEVLAYSLQKTGTKHDLIALVTEQIPSYHRVPLTSSGWKLHDIQSVKNHNTQYAARLDYIFSKLNIFALTNYDTVVYLDADTMVLENIDHLCDCPATKYCAVVRNTFFNAGVMVVKPNNTLFHDMILKSTSTHSYTGGDQGFLNNYFWNPEKCSYYDPKDKAPAPLTTIGARKEECYRLPGYYNGDIAMFVARNDHWQFDPDETRKQPAIIHYTMSELKPWNWMSYIFIAECWRWWDFYASMESINGWVGVAIALFQLAILLLLHLLISRSLAYVYKTKTPTKGPIPLYAAITGVIITHIVVLLFAYLFSTSIFSTPLGGAFVFCATYITLLDIFYSKLLIQSCVQEADRKLDHKEDFPYVLFCLFVLMAISLTIGLLNTPSILIYRIAIIVCGVIIIPMIFLIVDATKKFIPKTNLLEDGSFF